MASRVPWLCGEFRVPGSGSPARRSALASARCLRSALLQLSGPYQSDLAPLLHSNVIPPRAEQKREIRERRKGVGKGRRGGDERGGEGGIAGGDTERRRTPEGQGRVRGLEGGREGGRDGGRDGGRERRREGGREGGRD